MEVKFLRHNFLPSLYRQSTERLPSTILRREMALTLKKALAEEKCPSHEARENFSKCMVTLQPFLKSNPFNIDCSEEPIYAGDIPQWRPYKDTVPCYLIQIKFGKITGLHFDPGYFIFPIDPKFEKKSVKVFKIDLRSDDRMHLSPRKVYRALYNIFESGIDRLRRSMGQSRTSMTSKSVGQNVIIPRVRLHATDKDICLVMNFPDKTEVELIPTIAAASEGPFFVAKPFENDENPSSDMLWRVNYSVNEQNIIRAIASGDKSQRIYAAKVLTYICQKEWKLKDVTPYQIQNILLHELDFQIDNSPRWQRYSLDECLTLLLLRMQEFVRDRSLPHFFEPEMNMWDNFTDRQFTLMRSALDRLTRDDEEVMRVVRRARVEPISY